MSDILEDLSDDDFEAKVQDPSRIGTHEEAMAIIAELEVNAADIAGQIGVYQAEAQARLGEMPPDRQAWVRRASFALAMRRSEKDRVMKRDREIRGIYDKQAFNAAIGEKKTDKKVAAHTRMAAEAEARTVCARAKLEELQARRSVAKLFMDVAKERLSPDIFAEIQGAAKERHRIISSAEAT